MKLVADSGSTKTDWVLLDKQGIVKSINTIGFNPLYHSEAFIAEECRKVFDLEEMPYSEVKEVFYYGASVWDEEKAAKIRRALAQLFDHAEIIEVEHDLLGAARATCGREAGVACIIGTGSNTCLFDGSNVTDNVTNLGYFVGDEGSGAHLGKALVKAYFYRELPSALVSALEEEFPGGQAEFLDHIYSQPSPNVFLASLTKFLSAHRDHLFIQKLIYTSFAEFIDRHVRKYPGHLGLPIHFIGSVAFHFRDFLTVILEERCMKPGRFIQKPIDRLVEYHTHND
ncbi:MAG: hypothetical protein IPN74_03615 [Haliscomenobacter sp.]|nr:hypothetical protein [Haliscomenobacter sp.]MBK8877652.1 hypothetical protein [Haliscomenobacter sp.]